MKNLSEIVAENLQQLRAKQLVELNLVDQVKQMQTGLSNQFAFEDGDELTIKAGMAVICQMLTKNEKGVKTPTNYLAFPAEVVRKGQPLDREITISVRQLTQPTIVLADKQPKTITFDDMSKRFGDVTVGFATVPCDDKEVSLPYLAEPVSIKISVGTAYMPDGNNAWDGEAKAFVKIRERKNYGYAKA